MKTWVARLSGVALGLFLLIQLVPFGRDHTNPPVSKEVQWRSPGARNLVAQACYDCHSNQTTWPWYSNIAPVSWLVQHDVDEGRQKLNFSEWDRAQEGDESAELVQSGEMPPWYYILLHPQANLSQADEDALVEELMATLGGEQGEGDGEGDEEDK